MAAPFIWQRLTERSKVVWVNLDSDITQGHLLRLIFPEHGALTEYAILIGNRKTSMLTNQRSVHAAGSGVSNSTISSVLAMEFG